MEKIESLKFKTKDFLYRNKGRIKTCAKIGGTVIAIGTGVFLIIDNRKLTIDNKKLIIDNAKKEDIINCMKDTIMAKNGKIEELKDLCKRKDAYMCRLISKLLRQGSREGGREMAHRKQYLKQFTAQAH